MINIDLLFQMIIFLFLFGLFLYALGAIFVYFLNLIEKIFDKICAFFSKLSA